MIYSVRGALQATDINTAVVECGGVGFKCITSLHTLKQLPPTGADVLLYTYLSVREDAMDLFGFADKEELECFKMLISVNGVGPKAAVSILSELTPGKLALAIASGDSKALTKAQGVGAKIGQRITLELKDKLKTVIPTGSMDEDGRLTAAALETGGAVAEAVSALMSLGYSQSEAALAVSKTDPTLTVEEIIMQALRSLARQV